MGNMNEYHISSPLLQAAIWGGTECNQWIGGYTNGDRGYYGRALVEYFACRLFGIHRAPGYEPPYVAGFGFSDRVRFGKISEEEFEKAYEEFEELYYFTQKELLASGCVSNGKVKLNRSLKSYETDEILPQLLNKNAIIEFPANIITSYAYDGRLFDYGSWMSIVREVPVELIVLHFDCLYHPPYTCASSMHGGEYEVWVLEKNIFGYTRQEANCFKIKAIPVMDKEKAEKRIKEGPFMRRTVADYKEGSLLSSQIEEGFLPCQGNWIIRKLIELEKTKNEERTHGYWRYE